MSKEIIVSVLVFVLSCPLSVIGGTFVSFIGGDHPNVMYRVLRLVVQLIIFGLGYITVETSNSVFINVIGLSSSLSFMLSFALGSIVYILGILPHIPKVMDVLNGPEIRLKHSE